MVTSVVGKVCGVLPVNGVSTVVEMCSVVENEVMVSSLVGNSDEKSSPVLLVSGVFPVKVGSMFLETS